MTVEEALAVSAVRESESPRLDGDPGLGEETRRAMRVANVEGVLALASDNFAGPYVSLYALSLGASNTQIGLVNALPALLTNVLQIPFAILSDRLQRRKAFWVIGGGGMRVSWLPIALIPYFAVSPGAAVLAYIALLALRSVFAAASMPAWTSLMADMTPRSIRGAYFSNRNILINLSAFTATLASGAVLRYLGEPVGYQAVFLIAAAFGLAAGCATTRFPDFDAPARLAARAGQEAGAAPARRRGPGWRRRAQGRPAAGFNLQEFLAGVRQEKSFVTYALASAVWNFGVMAPQPLFPVHFVEVLGGTPGFWGVVSASTFFTTVLGQRYWGRLNDQFGGRSVLVAGGIIAGVIPGLWFLAYRPEHALWINLLSGLGWAGFNLAAFNLLLEVTPDRGRSTYVAAYNALIGLSQFTGPLLGGVAADLFGARPVFLASTLIRLAAWWAFAYRLKTAHERPVTWRDFIPVSAGALKRLPHEAAQLPGRVVRRLRARLLERRLRQKMERRRVETALQEALKQGEPGASGDDPSEQDHRPGA